MTGTQLNSEPYFEAKNLVTSLGDQLIFNGLDLKVQQGESVVIMGRSGEGKSVLLRHLLGLMKPDSGKVFIRGTDITNFEDIELMPFRKKMGILFQDGALFDFLTVADNVTFPLAEEGVEDTDDLRDRAREALKMVGLEEHMDELPMNLSGGMRKRVALARATITYPDCILCDEPTAGLDPVAAADINLLIREMVDAYNATAIVVTHDISSMNQIADRVVMLKNGKIDFSGTPEAINNSEDPSIKNFILGRSEHSKGEKV